MNNCKVLPDLINIECVKEEQGGLPDLLNRQATDAEAANTVKDIEKELVTLYTTMKKEDGEPPQFLCLRDL